MMRPAVEVADILRVRGDCFREQNRSWLGYQQLSVLRALTACRTAALGGHLDACSGCDHQAISYNSCRNRHCPKCQAQARQRWLARREQDLLSVPYFHVVFTLPHHLNPLCQRYPRLLYDLLFRASAQTMLEVAANPKHLGAKIGFLSILHTWGQNLQLHPHLHCVVPAGGFGPGYSNWIHPKYPFFLPVKALSRVFRGKFLDLLQRVPRQRRPELPSTLMQALLKHHWVVYAKPAFGGPTHVLRYLGRYTHRVAISNQRLLTFDGHHVTFRWRDYAHGNKQRIMTLAATEFLRRFCQHILPRGFVRIRHFGYLASAHRTALLRLARVHLKFQPQADLPIANTQVATWRCPQCGANMHIGPNLTSQQLAFRCRLPDSS
jgi:Putative transposase/Transposase zinc-binding domain